jgi:hypothetical protein
MMRYLKGMLDFGFCYTQDHEFRQVVYTYSDWARSVSDRKNTSRSCFSLGLALNSWQSKKKSNISLNTKEVEYIAEYSSIFEAI